MAEEKTFTFDAEEFNRDVQIGTDLDRDFRNQGSLYSFYSGQLMRASIDMEHKKIRAEVAETRCAKAFREKAAKDGIKITEKVVQEEVTDDSMCIKTRLEYVNAKAVYELIKNCLDALKQRRDMLVQIGAASREEMKGDLRMRSNLADEIAKNARKAAAETSE